MKKFSFLSALVCLFCIGLFTNCKKEKLAEYTGAWQMTISGTCYSEKTVIVNDDGSFGFQITCGGIVNQIEGTIDLKTGRLIGTISVGGLKACPEAVTGMLNESGTGSGTFDCLYFMAGDWTAIKIQ
jgi:hypothetical protein